MDTLLKLIDKVDSNAKAISDLHQHLDISDRYSSGLNKFYVAEAYYALITLQPINVVRRFRTN